MTLKISGFEEKKSRSSAFSSLDSFNCSKYCLKKSDRKQYFA